MTPDAGPGMTPAEIARVCELLGWDRSGEDAARAIGCSRRTWRRWLAGDAPVPQATAMLLRLIADDAVSDEDLERARGPWAPLVPWTGGEDGGGQDGLQDSILSRGEIAPPEGG